MPVAFVLSGGASLGASQAGMLDALYERGIKPDMLVGTSVGAINAAFIASRPPTVRVARELQQVWRGLSRGQIFPANPLTAGLGLLGMRDHSVPVGSLRRLLRTHLEFELLEDSPVALHIVAADVLSGEEVLLSDGPAIDAILASAAIPGVFPAVPWKAHMLVDGGILNNTPISHAVALGADRIVVLPAIGSERMAEVPRGAVAAGLTAVSRVITQRFASDLVRYADAAELIVLPPPVGGILPADFAHAEELIAEGLERARAALARHLRPAALRLAA
ncbi:MAG TPA: patatin-like phospholipase family protein [Solirubrobacteraceae bacterium]|nr:patatin-like phospholipase family protein [Solirubrobacteraceae bacterium]